MNRRPHGVPSAETRPVDRAGAAQDAVRPPGPRAVWLFPITYVLHLIEEYAAAGGFSAWARRTLGATLSVGDFLAWNAVGLGLLCIGTVMVSRRHRYRWIEMAMAIAVLGNAAAHVVASAATATYSPGLVTGTLLWLPLGAMRLFAAHRVSSRRGRTAGALVGAAAVLVPLLVLAARS